MRFTILVYAFVALVCASLQASANCLLNGKDLSMGIHYIDCTKIECLEDGDLRGIGCSSHECPPGTEIGFEDIDLSKPYPQCCGHPVCTVTDD